MGFRSLLPAVLAAAVTLASGSYNDAQALAPRFDKAGFLAETGATQATAAYPNAGAVGTGPVTSGSVTFTAGPGATNLHFGEWTSRLPGNDLAISGIENLNVGLAAPVVAFGFDFVEPETDPNVNAPFVNSTFQVTAFFPDNTSASFSFDRPNDQVEFVGFISLVGAFDRVEIRETTGGDENEFFGPFYTSAQLPVPEPATLALLGAGLAALGIARRRKRA